MCGQCGTNAGKWHLLARCSEWLQQMSPLKYEELGRRVCCKRKHSIESSATLTGPTWQSWKAKRSIAALAVASVR